MVAVDRRRQAAFTKGRPCRTIDLTDQEHAAVTALIKRASTRTNSPTPRDPLRSALAKLDPAAGPLSGLDERL
jgi:hypothetical protein